MIELPRGALRAGDRSVRELLSFGTNDLTQTALGLSRDDAEGKFLTGYIEQAWPSTTLPRRSIGSESAS